MDLCDKSCVGLEVREFQTIALLLSNDVSLCLLLFFALMFPENQLERRVTASAVPLDEESDRSHQHTAQTHGANTGRGAVGACIL
jgi:hypothetical protein